MLRYMQRITWSCSQAEPKFARTNSGDEDANLEFLLVQSIILVALFVVVRFCCVFWRKEKLKDIGLSGFLEKRRSLRSKKKELGKLISELEQKAAEEATSNEPLEDLGQIVKQKQGVERKLRNSYSLIGRDHTVGSEVVQATLPLYNGKMKSHSFHNSERMESVTIFNTFSDSSSVEGYSGSSSSSSSWETENPELEMHEMGHGEGEIVEASRFYSNPMYNEIEMDLAGEERRAVLKKRSHSLTLLKA